MEVTGGGGVLDESSRSWHWLPAKSDCRHHKHIIMSSKPSQNAKEIVSFTLFQRTKQGASFLPPFTAKGVLRCQRVVKKLC